MRLIFLDVYGKGKRTMVAENIASVESGFNLMYEDLKIRKPDFKSYYTNCSYLLTGDIWIDFGSHTEFYILEADKK